MKFGQYIVHLLCKNSLNPCQTLSTPIEKSENFTSSDTKAFLERKILFSTRDIISHDLQTPPKVFFKIRHAPQRENLVIVVTIQNHAENQSTT